MTFFPFNNKLSAATFTLWGLAAAILAALSVAVKLGFPDNCYTSWPMIALWWLIAIMSLTTLIKARIIRRPSIALLHFSLILVLSGGFFTWATSDDYEIPLELNSSGQCGDIGIELIGFGTDRYAGTSTPKDYFATLRITDRSDSGINSVEAVTAVNRPADFLGYRIFIKSIDYENDSATLSVTHDPAGTPLTYIGYALASLGMLLFFFEKNSRWRMALRRLPIVMIAIVPLSATACSGNASPDNEKNRNGDPSPQFARRLALTRVYYNQRLAPLATLSADFLNSISGRTSYKGLNAECVAAGFIFNFGKWKNEPIIKISDKSLREKIGRNRCSYAELVEHSLRSRLNAEDAARMELINELVGGRLLRVYPAVADEDNIVWLSPADNVPINLSDEQWLFIRKSFGYINELVKRRQFADAAKVLSKIDAYQQSVLNGAPAPESHTDTDLRIERFYIDHFCYARYPAYAAFALALLIAVSRIFRPRSGMIAVASVVLLSLWLLTAIALRWISTGHIPLANGYETMQFMAFLLLIATLFIGRRIPLFYTLGTIAAAVCMLVASFSGGGSAPAALMPVLRSPWLSIHVACVMTAYSLFAICAFAGIASIFSCQSARLRLADMNLVLLYPAVFLLGIGIFVGAVWANLSWGRYWGWDPKEVWALITFIIYSFPLHFISTGNPQRLNILSAAAFLSVLITYFGVNMLLGGLHSYA